MTESGYQLKNTLLNRINEQIILDHVKDCFEDHGYLVEGFKTGFYNVDLSVLDCYENIEPNEEQSKLLEQWEILESYIQCGIVYDMGDQLISLSGKLASGFIKVDNEGKIEFDSVGQPAVSEKAIEEFINSLAEEYNTWKKELVFVSTAGEEKIVPYQNYGTEIDVEKETEYLLKAFSEKRSEVHIPEYSHQGIVRGRNDIGDTYIEVNLSEQHVYAYKNGEKVAEGDCVSGNESAGHGTCIGLFAIQGKQSPAVLRGEKKPVTKTVTKKKKGKKVKVEKYGKG